MMNGMVTLWWLEGARFGAEIGVGVAEFNQLMKRLLATARERG